ncbi:MAG: hypothetical protein AABZ45_08190 [Pseudomonadota bacterium]
MIAQFGALRQINYAAKCAAIAMTSGTAKPHSVWNIEPIAGQCARILAKS